MSEFTLHDKSSAPQVLEAYQTLHQLALLSLPSLNPSRTFANLFRSMFW